MPDAPKTPPIWLPCSSQRAQGKKSMPKTVKLGLAQKVGTAGYSGADATATKTSAATLSATTSVASMLTAITSGAPFPSLLVDQACLILRPSAGGSQPNKKKSAAAACKCRRHGKNRHQTKA